jgi:uroporphyrin-III C-methyltransferase
MTLIEKKLSPNSPSPLVKLVGAGPGDPELLTIKALKALEWASLILIDDLVSEEICELIPLNCRKIYVGKRGGCQSTPQAFIEKLMIQNAFNGERVVRLKGGDPFIFGRGGEEVESMKASGIEVEVINGITSGLAAVTSLGVPLTHRVHAHGVVFLTGHAQPHAQSLDWENLGASAHSLKLTLIIYMGMGSAQRIQAGLLKTLPKETPVGLIERASTPHQRHVVSDLQDFCTQIELLHFSSPCVIVVGNVLKGLTSLKELSLEYDTLEQLTHKEA